MRARWASAIVTVFPLLAAAQAPVLQIQVVEGEGAVHAIGSRVAKFLTVRVTDELGKPVPGALVSFRVPEDGPSGVFLNGLPTEVVTTGPDGVAAAPGVRWSRLAGSFEVRVVAVKDQSRAGTVVPQYLAAAGGPDNGRVAAKPPAATHLRSRARNKWLFLGLAAAGAVGVGFSTGWAAGTRRELPKGPEPPRVGSPVISIGRP
jgi:hypothetical protein